MSKNPKVSVVILNFNGKNIISECVDAILHSDYQRLQIVLVDNASTDGSLAHLTKKYSKNKKIKIVSSDSNRQFAGGFNLGVAHATGELVFLVSSDVIVEPACIAELVKIAVKNKKYLVQPKILRYGQKNILDNVGGRYSIWGIGKGLGGGMKDAGQFDHDEVRDFAAATTFMMNRAFYRQLKGYDEWFVSHYEDVDLCLRARARGGKCWYSYKSRCYHKVSITYKKYVASEILLFNIRKNRVRVIIKNFNGLHRVIRLLLLLPTCVITALQDILTAEPRRRTVTFRAVYAGLFKTGTAIL